jgi:hypothetical protein
MKMVGRKIMYVCEYCADENPEGCGHFDPNDLAVMPNGTWLCENCADEFSCLEACGAQMIGTVDDAEWPLFSDFPKPQIYTPT